MSERTKILISIGIGLTIVFSPLRDSKLAEILIILSGGGGES